MNFVEFMLEAQKFGVTEMMLTGKGIDEYLIQVKSFKGENIPRPDYVEVNLEKDGLYSYTELFILH